jgi:hypothetical protein
VLFIRAQSTIRADGPPSAQVISLQFDVSFRICRSRREDIARSRANRVFRTDEKRIRTENAVFDKSKGGSGWLLYKITTLQ